MPIPDGAKTVAREMVAYSNGCWPILIYMYLSFFFAYVPEVRLDFWD